MSCLEGGLTYGEDFVGELTPRITGIDRFARNNCAFVVVGCSNRRSGRDSAPLSSRLLGVEGVEGVEGVVGAGIAVVDVCPEWLAIRELGR